MTKRGAIRIGAFRDFARLRTFLSNPDYARLIIHDGHFCQCYQAEIILWRAFIAFLFLHVVQLSYYLSRTDAVNSETLLIDLGLLLYRYGMNRTFC